MNDSIENITQPSAAPPRDPFAKFIGESMDQSFENGFKLARVRAINMLNERANWLRSEYLNGGNFEHLSARERECRAIVELVQELTSKR